MHPIIYTENLVTSCPKLGELHELMILVVNGLQHTLHGFQLTGVFQNYHPARAFPHGHQTG